MTGNKRLLMVSMPYAKFDSDWFAKVPNINLGSAAAYLNDRGWEVKTFHFHMHFLPFLRDLDHRLQENFSKLAGMGVEYFSLDYLFATLLFDEDYSRSSAKLSKRIAPLRLGIEDLESLREAVIPFIDQCLEKLRSHLDGASAVAFSSSHFQITSSLLLASRIKKDKPDIVIIFGGKDCSGGSGYQILSRFPFVDLVGFAECESALAVLDGFLEDRGISPAGFLYRKSKGKIGRGEKISGIDLNSGPFPEYDLKSLDTKPKDIIIPLELGRGCTWGECTFCPDRSYGIVCREKDPVRITAEIEHYLGLSPELTRYIILDADSLKNPDGISQLAQSLEDKGLTIIFGEMRAERITRETLKDFLSLGRWAAPFQVGIESFSDRLLKLMNKGISTLKNVEAIKAAAELGAPIQFNIITSFPRMEPADLEENLKVMERIKHLLVHENISLYPSEFYLPPDCEIFDRDSFYRIRKSRESTFSAAFLDFDLHSLGNYPHYLAFDNHEEQMIMSNTLREKIAEINSLKGGEYTMSCRLEGPLLKICKRGKEGRQCQILSSPGKEIYLSALSGIRIIERAAAESGVPEEEVRNILTGLDNEGLVLLSDDGEAFLSLAIGEEDLL